MIAFCTTCKGRTVHLKETLPQNLADNADYANCKFIILDYNSQDDLLAYLKANHLREIESGRLVVYSFREPGPFHMAQAKNLAMRCGILEGADIVVTLDADNFTGPGFAHYIADLFENEDEHIFLCPGVFTNSSGRTVFAPGGGFVVVRNRGIAGRLVIRGQDFIKAGGYDNKFDTWRGEDMDLKARLLNMGYAARTIEPLYLNAIRHGSGLRFKEYPHAQQYETQDEVDWLNSTTNTVVNDGKFGCGFVFRNLGLGPLEPPIELKTLPTRVFGIGLQRTATTSLHRAFEILDYDSFHWNSGNLARDIWDEMNQFGRSRTLEQWYALCDTPIPLLYKQLDTAYPGSKFILTITNEDKWLESMERLWNPKTNPNRWEWDVYPFTNRIHRALYGQTEFDREVMLARYRKHNADVIAYFKDRPSDLLVMDMDFGWPLKGGAGWRELCRFLDKPIPSVPYPFLEHTVPTKEQERTPIIKHELTPLQEDLLARRRRRSNEPLPEPPPAAQEAVSKVLVLGALPSERHGFWYRLWQWLKRLWQRISDSAS